jgi:hypothetical protein
MNLVNFPKVRIKRYDLGYVVEVKKRTWYGLRYWKHIISAAGIESEPWYYKDYDIALQEAVQLFKWDLIYYSVDKN